jgi:hypothetical protein
LKYFRPLEGAERKVNRKERRTFAAINKKERKRSSVWKSGFCYHNAYRWLLYRPELSEDHYIVHGFVYHEQSGIGRGGDRLGPEHAGAFILANDIHSLFRLDSEEDTK